MIIKKKKVLNELIKNNAIYKIEDHKGNKTDFFLFGSILGKIQITKKIT